LHTKVDDAQLFISDIVIGRGQHGIVYKGTYRSENAAIKIIKLADLQEKDWKYIQRELAIMSLVKHPNVVNCMAAKMSHKKRLWISNF